jgi:hypothetical protein
MTDASPETEARYAAAIAVRRIDKWLRDRPAGEPLTLLDTGLGSFEACTELLRAARKRGRALRVVSLISPDNPEPTAPSDLDTLELVSVDPFQLVDRFGPASFDFVLTQLRVASLREVPRLTFLRIIDRLSRSGVVWVERAGDGGLSKRAVTDLIERVGMDYLRVGRPLASPYFVIRGRKPAPGS